MVFNINWKLNFDPSRRYIDDKTIAAYTAKPPYMQLKVIEMIKTEIVMLTY